MPDKAFSEAQHPAAHSLWRGAHRVAPAVRVESSRGALLWTSCHTQMGWAGVRWKTHIGSSNTLQASFSH